MICSDDISNIQILTYDKSMQQIKKSHDTWICNMYHLVSSDHSNDNEKNDCKFQTFHVFFNNPSSCKHTCIELMNNTYTAYCTVHV